MLKLHVLSPRTCLFWRSVVLPALKTTWTTMLHHVASVFINSPGFSAFLRVRVFEGHPIYLRWEIEQSRWEFSGMVSWCGGGGHSQQMIDLEDPPWNLPQPGVHIQIGPQWKYYRDLRIELEVEDAKKTIDDPTWPNIVIRYSEVFTSLKESLFRSPSLSPHRSLLKWLFCLQIDGLHCTYIISKVSEKCRIWACHGFESWGTIEYHHPVSVQLGTPDGRPARSECRMRTVHGSSASCEHKL